MKKHVQIDVSDVVSYITQLKNIIFIDFKENEVKQLNCVPIKEIEVMLGQENRYVYFVEVS